MMLKLYGGREGERLFRNPADTAEMVAHCRANSHIWFRTVQGDARRAKVNGAVWQGKRDPGRCRVPIKYGMYEFATFDETDRERVLIPYDSNLTDNSDSPVK